MQPLSHDTAAVSIDTASTDTASLYDETYFREHLGPLPYDRRNVSLVEFFAGIADEIIRSLRPITVFDAGCAMGFLVEALWDRGIHATGMDISSYAIANVRRDISPFCRVGSLVDPISGRYDLVTCIEVLEHLPEQEALRAMRNVASITDTILFSSTATDIAEPTHFNVHQPIWWLEHFQRLSFSPDPMYDASFVAPHAMLLRKTETRLDFSILWLYAELLRFKHAVVARNQQLQQQEIALQSSESELKKLKDNEQQVGGMARNDYAVLASECEQFNQRTVGHDFGTTAMVDGTPPDL